MRIGFILGAGVSIPAGLPDTKQLTERILHVDNYTLHTDRTFVRATSELICSRTWPKQKNQLNWFLEYLRGHCQAYFDSEKNKQRSVNYEDLFFAANQLYEHLSQEYENPALESFARAVLAQQNGVANRDGLEEIAGLTCDYIYDVVAMQLRPRLNAEMLNHLACLVDAATDPSLRGCDIFTLNHDLLIESVLEQKGMKLVDGFGEANGDVAWWMPKQFSRPSRHYFLKLHGSVDWLMYRGRLAKILGNEPNLARTADGNMLEIPDSTRKSRVLLGTFNKIRDYFGRPYFDLISTFRRQLDRISTVIISGYSLGDKGINTVLTEWMYESAHRNILILHARGDQCIPGARGAIRNLWGRFGGGRMLIHPEYLMGCDWRDLVKRYGLCG